MELLINKKYLVRLERYTKFGKGGYYDPFAVRYVFALPKNAGLPDGYTVYIDVNSTFRVVWEKDNSGNKIPVDTLNLEHNKTYRLTDRPDDAVYVAKMTENREEGKRYKQFKYTAEELYALYQNIDLASAKLAVAKVDIYLDGRAGNEHKVIYGNRIDKTVYLVGKVQGCWFYCSELNTKRRIGSHGVTVLGRIDAADEQAARQLIRNTEKEIERCKENYSLIHSPRSSLDRAWWKVNYYCDEKNRNAPQDKEVLEAIRLVRSSAERAMQLIDKKLSEEDAALAKIASELEEQLKKICIKEGDK